MRGSGSGRRGLGGAGRGLLAATGTVAEGKQCGGGARFFLLN
jgi:hypothetical protein